MSGLTDDLQPSGQEPSHSMEELGHHMYNEKKVRFHTQIDDPDSMVTLQDTAEVVEKRLSPRAGKFMKNHLKEYYDDMVAFKRERAHETERMVEAKATEERMKKSAQEILLGVNR